MNLSVLMPILDNLSSQQFMLQKITICVKLGMFDIIGRKSLSADIGIKI